MINHKSRTPYTTDFLNTVVNTTKVPLPEIKPFTASFCNIQYNKSCSYANILVKQIHVVIERNLLLCCLMRIWCFISTLELAIIAVCGLGGTTMVAIRVNKLMKSCLIKYLSNILMMVLTRGWLNSLQFLYSQPISCAYMYI